MSIPSHREELIASKPSWLIALRERAGDQGYAKRAQIAPHLERHRKTLNPSQLSLAAGILNRWLRTLT